MYSKAVNSNYSSTFYLNLVVRHTDIMHENQLVFGSTVGYHHHFDLDVYYYKRSNSIPANSLGLFHATVVHSTGKTLLRYLNNYAKVSQSLI